MASGRSPLRYCFGLRRRHFSAKPFYSSDFSPPNLNPGNGTKFQQDKGIGVEDDAGLGRPISLILKDLNKKVPDTLLRTRTGPAGSSVKYLPWHIANRILNLHAPEWSGEVRSITYSADGKSVSVVYRVTLYGTDAEVFRESTGTASIDEAGYGDAVQKAEAMAFRRACARLGLGLHLYHDDTE